MVRFIIGPPKINNRTSDSNEKVKSAINKLGKSQIINAETQKFKMGNLDNMMRNYEVIQKVEHQVEIVLKKLSKAYLEINPKADINSFLVDSRKSGPGKQPFCAFESNSFVIVSIDQFL